MYLRDIMSTNIEAARPGESLERAERRMRSRGIHHLVVISRGTVVGLICDATLQARLADGVATVGNAMQRHIVTASPEMTVAQAARMMRGRAEGALPVFAGTRLVGIVTISDLLDVLGRRFASKARARRARPAA